MPRARLTQPPQNLNLDQSSLSNLVIAQTMNSFTGVVNIHTGTIYICGLSGAGDDHYGTVTPIHQVAFPQMVRGQPVPAIIHNDPITQITSHDQLANLVVNRGGGHSADEFAGFSLRFRSNKQVVMSPTSRTLNSGAGFENGNIEEVLMQALLAYLGPKLALLGFTLEETVARTNPNAAQAARGGPIAPSGLFAAIRGNNI